MLRPDWSLPSKTKHGFQGEINMDGPMISASTWKKVASLPRSSSRIDSLFSWKSVLEVMGCHPRLTVTGNAWPQIPVRCQRNNLLQITLTIWPPTAAKYLAEFCPKFLPPQTIACSNFRAWRASSGRHEAQHTIDIRYYLSWALIWLGTKCNVRSLWSSILKHLGYTFLP